MFHRRFSLNVNYFSSMALFGSIGIFFTYRGVVIENYKLLLAGAVLVVIGAIFLLLQFVPIPTLDTKVEAEIAKAFPAALRDKVVGLLVNGFSGYQENGIYMDMIKYSQGDMNRLAKLSRALNHQSDFRDAYPILEYTNKELNKK
jgi:hypothetical protein